MADRSNTGSSFGPFVRDGKNLRGDASRLRGSNYAPQSPLEIGVGAEDLSASTTHARWVDFFNRPENAAIVANEKDANDAAEEEFYERLHKFEDELEHHSKVVRRRITSPVLPSYLHNLSLTTNYVRLTSKDKTWTAQDPKLSFGSRTAYKQGILVEPSKDRTGNTHNVFVIDVHLTDVRNPFPWPIGIRLLHKYKPQGAQTGAQRNAEGLHTEYFPRADVIYDNKEFHAIIQPDMNTIATSKRIHLFQSGDELKHSWGEAFPNTTVDTLKTTDYGANYFHVPGDSPVVYYIMEKLSNGYDEKSNTFTADVFADPMPPLPPDDVTKDEERAMGKRYFSIPKKEYARLEKVVKEKLRMLVPVVDMKTFTVEVTHLPEKGELVERAPSGCLEFMLHTEIAFREKNSLEVAVSPADAPIVQQVPPLIGGSGLERMS